MRRFCFAFVSLAIALTVPATQAAEESQWIWLQSRREVSVAGELQKAFSTDKPVTAALLRGAAMYAGLEVSLDGKQLVVVEAYDPLFQLDVTEQLTVGDHRLIARTHNVPGPAAVFLLLELTFADGSQQTIFTDDTWQAAMNGQSNAAASFGAVGPRLLIPDAWQAGTSAFDNYEQWRQAQGSAAGMNTASFLVSPGFEIQLVRTAQPGEDSWISLAFDPQGKVVIAKEKVGLLRMTLSADGAQVSAVETIDNTLQECRGLVFFRDGLFADANNSKGLYYLPASRAGQLGQPQLIFGSAGGVGHGRNDLALGPDQQIYVIHGDSVNLPTGTADFTSPFREARRGQSTSEGHLLRINPQNGQVAIMASGLRNPFGIDFNEDGEIFTYDADAEHDMGAPWYRPTRVNHLVTGGDFGWRGVTGAWPPYYPDHPDDALPNIDIGKGSPTAVKFGTRSHFPGRFRQALFILDWAYGRILAVHQVPRGASYLMAAETFLKGRPLNVTDLDFGPDGSMYFVTGGRGTQSALYRVRHSTWKLSGERPAEEITETVRFASLSRIKRRQLEDVLLKPIDDDTLNSVWKQLSDDDPWIRQAARNVVEQQPLARWQRRALIEEDRTIALSALMALARAGDASINLQILQRMNELDWKAAPQSGRLVATYIYQLCLPPSVQLSEPFSRIVLSKLLGAFPDRAAAVNQRLSLLIARFQSAEGLAKTIELLRHASQQAESLHYLYVLRHQRTGWTSDQRAVYFEALANAQSYQGGAGMPDFLKQIRQEAVATLTDSERQALGKLIDGSPEETPNEAVADRQFVRKWTLDDLAGSLTDANDKRDLARGRQMFAAASCMKCHRLRGHGRLIGPDLTSATSRFSRRDILESIISPSKVVPEAYRSLQIITTDGRSYVGRVALGGDYRSETLHLATDPLNPYKTIAIPKKEIDQQQPSATSLMPEGLLNSLTKEEILDLLAFIERGDK